MTEKDLEIQKLRAEVKKLTARAEKAEAQLAASTADVEPVVRGEWVDYGSFVTCSACGEEQYGHDNRRIRCPNCGAHMTREDKP